MIMLFLSQPSMFPKKAWMKVETAESFHLILVSEELFYDNIH